MFSLHVDTGRSWRGGQRQVMYTVLGLRAQGHRAALVAHPGGELRRRMSEGLDLFPLAPRSEVDLTAAWRLSRLIKQLQPDIVHAHDPHAVAMSATALSMATLPRRVVFVASRRSQLRMARHSFSRWKYGQVGCFVASTGAIREQMIADGIRRDRTAVISDGVDVDRIERLPPANVHAEFFLPTHAPVVGNVAALVPQKGQQHLIDAAALVVRSVPDARFVIVGDGDLHGLLEHHVRHRHLERHVFLAGFRVDAMELTKSFDVFAVSSLFEGTCTALIDAMAASRPAVATRVGGIPEVMVDGATGFMVPPRDPAAMADRIVQLLRDPALRERMGAAALGRARERFTIDQMVAEVSALYERLAAGKSP